MQDTVGAGGSLSAFRAELALCATIVAVLLAKIVVPRWKSSAFYLTLLGLLAAIVPGFSVALGPVRVGCRRATGIPAAKAIFTGTLVADSFTVVLRGLLLLFAMLFTTFTQVAGVSDQDDMTEFYVLMLGALLGMCLMISANHILIVVLGVEMASVPCYVLAGMQRQPAQEQRGRPEIRRLRRRHGRRDALRHEPAGRRARLGPPADDDRPAGRVDPRAASGPIRRLVLVLGGLMLMVGVAFKLSAVPFHFWAPDVFEGATAEVAAFLSVASKAAALGLLVRLATGFAFPSGLSFPELRSRRLDGGAGRPGARAAVHRRADLRCWPPSPAPSATWPPTGRRT